VLALLEAHPHIVMDEGFDGSEDRLEEPDPEEGEAKVWGNMVAFLERLDDELFKSLQARPRAPAAPTGARPCPGEQPPSSGSWAPGRHG
jgi:hypothetical protein